MVRSYHYYRSDSVREGAPLVLVLHGSMGTGPGIRRMFGYGFDLAADKHGFIVVYPDGFNRHWNDCRTKAPCQAKIRNVDDLGFVDALIEHFVTRQQVNPEKVFATGFSNGGQMSLRLFMERPQRVRAIAALNSNLPETENFDCSLPKSGSAPSALLVAGTDDPVAPYSGGEVVFMGKSRGRALSADATADQLLHAAGILNSQPIESVLPDHNKNDGVYASEKIWRGTGAQNSKASEVRLLTLHGAGHTLAHPKHRTMPSKAGKFSRDFIAADYIWSFFDATLD
ncbi:alpha/beta fold hydrolase [Porticoccaceae bacterium]|nr:alpha/beta fold hydrolase [Porticoccaceae bacterium]